MVSILNAPDNSFRIFSWNIPLNDGSFLFYGAIKYNSPTIKLIPLIDKSFEMEHANSAILKPTYWYGARYYDILSFGKNQYILLGWKGQHADYSKKVIEVLNVNNQDEVTFGATIFSDIPQITRKVFTYSRQSSMYLKYNPHDKRIEFDHIVPLAPNLSGNNKYYVPDLTYDGYFLKNNRLQFVENINIQNAALGDEDNYIDTNNSNRTKKSGIK